MIDFYCHAHQEDRESRNYGENYEAHEACSLGNISVGKPCDDHY